MTATFVMLGLLAAFVLYLVAMYNSLILNRNRTKEAWSDIDVQLKRRHDLIPNLIASVKGYMKHERELLENVTKARTQAMDAQKSGDTKALAKAESSLGNLLGSLRVAFEAYPDLKANQNMAQLMDELSDTENKIQSSRRFYNGMVRDFNTKTQSFPGNLVAGAFHFTPFEFFEIEDAKERENVKVAF
ncbi:MAG: LemA family protein [Candidatus Magasanikbacteria bacterium]|nr:LemA family protein [Candidatus Magasanikbacteria bacterium]